MTIVFPHLRRHPVTIDGDVQTGGKRGGGGVMNRERKMEGAQFLRVH